MKRRRILGIDPGLANTGFGVVDFENGRISLVSYGCIETSSDTDHSLRILSIYNRLLAIIKEFNPDEAEMESLYFAKNVSSAMAVAEAKGVITLCLAQNCIPLTVYTPNQIKYAVSGSKSADKETVQQYVKILLNLKEIPSPDHAADALAGAICHINSTF